MTEMVMRVTLHNYAMLDVGDVKLQRPRPRRLVHVGEDLTVCPSDSYPSPAPEQTSPSND